ncbi:hypothetical protein [Sphingobacterium sp. UGAL515B_05]|uniref:hypothetical protein n=1 Tax=Sphingobacterium sp. UGAL515B_05 TaxID=2986767 RepID=UPI00295507D7|nr:hypothetical protein [Sphingobacterium sp. UGAL515B_05]WON93909.1 hypothetical protein OK025_21990 [Sphingobacterium sp. UGAL515B_05]
MKYAIVFGSNVFIGTNGVLKVNSGDKTEEFFRIREIYNERSEGSFLAVDCDIKDIDGKREVKLFKNRPVATDENINVSTNKNVTEVMRSNGTTIIKIEQLSIDDPTLHENINLESLFREQEILLVLRITGNFYAGSFLVESDYSKLKIGSSSLSGNILIGGGDLYLTSNELSFG